MKKIFVFLFFLPVAIFALGKKEPVLSEPVSKEAILTVEIDGTNLSLEEQYKSGYWSIRSLDNKLTVIGVSNPMLKRDSEIASAKEDAARKVAMFYGIHGKIEAINRTGYDFFDYLNNKNVNLRYDTNYETYIDQLTFDPQNDVFKTSEAIFVRFQYDIPIIDIVYKPTMIDGRPSWTRNQDVPEFDGYVTAVGFSQNQRRLKDTIFKSTEDVITRMIETSSTTVNSKTTDDGRNSSNTIYTRSRGRLSDFIVIDFWIEPKSRSVYTLAIARFPE